MDGQENLINTIFYSFGFYDFEISQFNLSVSSSSSESSSDVPERIISLEQTKSIIDKVITNIETALKCFGNYFKSVKEYMDRNRGRLRDEIRKAHHPSSLHEPTFPEWTTMIYSSVAYYDNCFDLYKVHPDPYYIIQKYINVSTIEEMCAELDVDYGHDFKHFNEIQYIGNIVSKVLQKDDIKLRTIMQGIKSDTSTEEADATQNNSAEEAPAPAPAPALELTEMLPQASKRKRPTKQIVENANEDEDEDPKAQKAAKLIRYDEKQFSKNLLINLGYMSAAEYYGKNEEDEMRLSFTFNPAEDEMFKLDNPAGRSLSNKSSWRAIGQEDTWISIDYVRGKPWNYQTKVVLSSNGFDDIEEFKQYIKLNDIGTEIRTVATAADLAAPSGCLYKNVGKISESHKFFTVKQDQTTDRYIFIIVTYNLNPDAKNTLELTDENCVGDNAPENIFFSKKEQLDVSNKFEAIIPTLSSSAFEHLNKLKDLFNNIGKSLLVDAKTPNIQQRIMERLSKALKGKDGENIFKQSDDELSLQIDELFKEIQHQNNVIDSLTKKGPTGEPTGEPLNKKKGERDKQVKILKQICVDNFKKLIEYIKTAYINLLSSGSTINLDVIDNLIIILELLNVALSTKQINDENDVFKQIVNKLKTSKRCGITSFGSSIFQLSPPISPVSSDPAISSDASDINRVPGKFDYKEIDAANSLVQLGKRSSDAVSKTEYFNKGVKNPQTKSLFAPVNKSNPQSNVSSTAFSFAPPETKFSAPIFSAPTKKPNFVFGEETKQEGMELQSSPMQPAMQSPNKSTMDPIAAIKRGAYNQLLENDELLGVTNTRIEAGVNTLLAHPKWQKYINDSLDQSNTQKTIQTLINDTAAKVFKDLTKKGGKTKKQYKKKYVKYTNKYIKNNKKSRKYKTVKQSKQTRRKM